MDVTNTSDARFNLAIERFLARDDVLQYHEVTFHLGPDLLTVSSWSQWRPDRVTQNHAHEGIARGKAVLEQFKAQNAELRASIEALPQEHCFGYDYGGGSIAIARERDGHFEWLHNGENDG